MTVIVLTNVVCARQRKDFNGWPERVIRVAARQSELTDDLLLRSWGLHLDATNHLLQLLGFFVHFTPPLIVIDQDSIPCDVALVEFQSIALQKRNGMKHSKLQLQVLSRLIICHLLYVYPEQVLSLFKECMRAAQQKPGFEQTVRAEFKRNSALPRSHLVK